MYLKNKKQLIFMRMAILLVSFLLISLVSAQTYKVENSFDLKIPFEVNGSNPSSTATCNVSIQYPNGTYVRDNNVTTNMNNGEFNITLSSGEMNVTGEYKWVAACCDLEKCARGYDIFEITRTGNVTLDNLPILYGVMIFVIFGVACFFLFLSLKVTEGGVKIFLMLASLVFLLGSVGVGVAIADDTNITLGISNLMGNILFAMAMIFVVIFFYIFIRQIVSTINLFRVKRGLAMPIGEYKVKGNY